MCGIIGIISEQKISKRDLWEISKDAERRGVDSSGILFNSDEMHSSTNTTNCKTT